MVTKCANPSCDRSFRYLRGGTLFIHEPKSVRPLRDAEFQESFQRCEYSWLCEQCARTMSVTLDRNGDKVIACRPTHIEPA
jgi:hypothetical protein